MTQKSNPPAVQAPAEQPRGLAKLEPNMVLKPDVLRNYTDKLIPQLAAALPAAMKANADRFARCLITEVQRSEFLAGCSGLSLLGGMIQSAQLGLEIGGTLGQAYLVPYWNNKLKIYEAQMQVGYRGFINLAFRSPRTRAFHGHLVYANEPFDISYGTGAEVFHKPLIKGDKGDLIGAYAYFLSDQGGKQVHFMQLKEIEDHRDRFSKAAQKDAKSEGGFKSPWTTNFEAMALKTPIRMLAKMLPVSTDLTHAAMLDEYGNDGHPQNLRVLASDVAELSAIPDRSRTAEAIEAEVTAKA